MMLYTAVASCRPGKLLANDNDRELIKQADDWIIAQQIKNPPPMTDALTLGTWKSPLK